MEKSLISNQSLEPRIEEMRRRLNCILSSFLKRTHRNRERKTEREREKSLKLNKKFFGLKF